MVTGTHEEKPKLTSDQRKKKNQDTTDQTGRNQMNPSLVNRTVLTSIA